MNRYGVLKDRNAFRNYLKKMDPEATAGKPGNNFFCPLANYLVNEHRTYPAFTAAHSKVGIWVYTHDFRTYCNPKWAIGFINKVDSIRRSEVTIQECLDILDSLTPVRTFFRKLFRRK